MINVAGFGEVQVFPASINKMPVYNRVGYPLCLPIHWVAEKSSEVLARINEGWVISPSMVAVAKK
jgi:hypothetical protein